MYASIDEAHVQDTWDIPLKELICPRTQRKTWENERLGSKNVSGLAYNGIVASNIDCCSDNTRPECHVDDKGLHRISKLEYVRRRCYFSRCLCPSEGTGTRAARTTCPGHTATTATSLHSAMASALTKPKRHGAMPPCAPQNASCHAGGSDALSVHTSSQRMAGARTLIIPRWSRHAG